jgi:hypothetical protein
VKPIAVANAAALSPAPDVPSRDRLPLLVPQPMQITIGRITFGHILDGTSNTMAFVEMLVGQRRDRL